jgi:hypothetical protein
MQFRPHPDGDKRRQSATALIKLLLSQKDAPSILLEDVKTLVDRSLWLITEADGKYKTRYWTKGALACSDKKQLRHEHPYQRSKMVAALLKAAPNDVDAILNDAIGCIVTKDEDRRLREFGREHDGWERYRRAGLEVFDTATKERKV